MAFKTVIITGANTGLGFHCAKSIANSGQNWHIILACRNLDKAKEAKQQLIKECDYRALSIMKLDLGSLQSVRDFVEAFKLGSFGELDGLICNAGLQFSVGNYKTLDGYEITFGVNHLGHFLLTNLLLAQMSENARIIVVGSGTHDPDKFEGKIEPAKYLGAKRLSHAELSSELTGMQRYTTSKLCNLLFTYELNRRLRNSISSITVNAYDPGGVPQTNLLRGEISGFLKIMRALMKSGIVRAIFNAFGIQISTPQKSGNAMAKLLLEKELDGISGKFFQLTKEVSSSKDSRNLEFAQDLWSASMKMVQLDKQ
ncbi:MAG: SDR family NAD(P)-dependent oxidoreductase [Cyclobacteriaceae bacterium]|nr:SDR family NAD(P)-dependent oxidoreductase [Cyclobacteriaceae bacterium HetDA_MAG_MS6]